MRVLIITQKIDENDNILGFFCSWLKKLAKRLDKIYVLALEGREVNLAENINLYYLNKENGNTGLIRRFLKFNQVLANLCLSKKIDIVFAHMCPEYAILAWPYAKLKNIPLVMWYAHGEINMRLRIAHFLVNRVVSSSKDGFRINSKKLVIVGQGIDIEKFKTKDLGFKIQNKEKIILSVGRISPIKNYEALIGTADILVNQKNIRNLKFRIVGGVPLESQNRYLDFLKHMVRECRLQDYVQFVGPAPYTQIQNYYQNCDLFVSTSNTGSLDKVVLEAMACGKVILTSNDAFKGILDGYSHELMFEKDNISALADKITSVLNISPQSYQKLGQELRNIVVERHSLDTLIESFI